MSPIKEPDNLLPRGRYPQKEPPFDIVDKNRVQVALMRQAEASLKICNKDHNEIMEEMRRRQLLDYYEEEDEETENDQSDYVDDDSRSEGTDCDTSSNDEDE